jgi:hypothetical protein
MKMYVGNASMNDHLFIYSVMEESKDRRVTIRQMSQVLLGDNLNQPSIDAIVKQQSKYGFVQVSEIKGIRNRPFTRLIYSIDRPIPSLMIQLLYDFNRGVQVDMGKRIQEDTAIIANNEVVKQLEEARRDGLDADIKDISVTIQEEEPKGGFDRPVKEVTSVGFKMDPKAPRQKRRA